MRKNKGISVITLIVTIIVLILIASVTIYTGGNALDQSRIKTAKDRMSTVMNAVAAHEKELGFKGVVVSSSTGDYRLLNDRDYEIMGLEDYKNNEQMPPIYIYKGSGDGKEKVYKLKTPKIVRTNLAYHDSDYVYDEFKFEEQENIENRKIEFDTVKGVNRPLLTKDMMAVRTYFYGDGSTYSEPVNNIYDEDWYDYSKTSPNWANVKMNDNLYYVWIPRFAYKIQDFYVGTDLKNVPSSAIDIVFLKGTSDYMANDEVLPSGYQVHPAFKYPDHIDSNLEINIPGFWVAKYNVNSMVDLLFEEDGTGGVMDEIAVEKLHPSGTVATDFESHLIKNTEWAAIAYLSFSTVGKTESGVSLPNNPSAIFDLNIRQFVAGGLKKEIPGDLLGVFDRYSINDMNNQLSYERISGEKLHGDAIIATSNVSGDSSWFGGTADRISSETPFILRGVDSSLFSYSATKMNPDRGAGCRNTMILKSSIVVPEENTP